MTQQNFEPTVLFSGGGVSYGRFPQGAHLSILIHDAQSLRIATMHHKIIL